MKHNASSNKKITVVSRLISDPDLLAFILPLALILPNVLLCITDTMPWWMRIVNILLPLSVYYLLTSCVKRIGLLTASLFVLMALNSFQIVVLYLFGERVIAIDMFLNVATTQPSEAIELLVNLLFPLFICAAVYLSLTAWGVVAIIKQQQSSATYRRRMLRFSLVGLLSGAIMLGAGMASEHSALQLRNLYPYNVCSNIATASKRIKQSLNYPKTSAAFTYHATDDHPADSTEIHLLVIGETSRAINWQLAGYGRETNPELAKRSDVVFFDKAISQSNTTHKCVPMLLSVVEPSTFDSIIARKSIITAFKEAGYKTAYFTTQPKNNSYNEYFANEADTTLFVPNQKHHDMYLVELMSDFVDHHKGEKLFVVLHTYGSHFNYIDRLPDSFHHFRPDGDSNASEANRPQLINAYDNTIRYTDHLLATIIRRLEQERCLASLAYVSDHGEDIFDDSRERFLHASPSPTYYQLHVPLLFWTSDAYNKLYPSVRQNLVANRHKYVAPPQQLFHTLTQITGLSTPWFDPANSLASDKFTSPSAVFLDDYNEAVRLEESGLKQHDIELFHSIGVL